MALKATNTLAQLPSDIIVNHIEKREHFIELFISYPLPEDRYCPHCGSHHCVIKDYRRQTVHHIPLNKTGTLLTFRKPRFFCKDCQTSFADTPSWLHPTLRMTSELFNTLWADLQDLRSKRDIAYSNCVTEAIVDSVIDCLVMEHPSCLPETLCIDEFKGSSGIWDSGARKWKKPGDYHCNIANGDNGYVLDILPKHDKATLQEYFRRFPLSERQQVKYFTCDMHGGYISLAKQTFPNAIICIDMFHVVKLLNERMDEIRNILQNEFRDNGDEASYQLLKRSRLMLITAEANQRTKWKDKYADRQDRLKKIFEIAPDIEVAYDALQEFHHILRTDLYGLQHSLLSDWIRKYSSSEAPKVRSAAHTIRRHKGYILNSFRYHKSNAPCEGLNNKIKVLKRNAYGFHSFEDFRKRILLACGNTKLVKEIHTMKDRKGGSKS